MAMDHLIIIGENASQYTTILHDSSFYPVPCKPEPMSLTKVRAMSTYILWILEHETPEMIIKMSIYLTDLCIEEEKFIYIYGPKNLVDIATEKIPKLYVMGTYFKYEHKLETAVQNIRKNVSRYTPDKKHILMVDDDLTFFSAVSLYLKDKFDIAMARGNNLREIMCFIDQSDLVIFSAELAFSVLEFHVMSKAMADRMKKFHDFRAYYVVESKELPV